MKIPAREWNKMVDWLLRNRVRSVLGFGDAGWAHPWKTRVAWNADDERFEARINPGFVNDADVTALIDGKDVPLTDYPAIPVTSTRSVPGDDGFFARLGVYSPQVDDFGNEIEDPAAPDVAQRRVLRAADIVLYHDRPSAAAEWTITPAETGANAQVKIVYRTAPGSRTGGYVRAIAELQPIAESDPLSILTGEAADATFDAILAATVYLLSPAGSDDKTPVDARWTPYVRHNLFWNADYTTTGIAPTSPTQNIELNLGGIGANVGAQITVNRLLAQDNDAANNALALLSANRVEGHFTTPGQRVPRDYDRSLRLDPPFPFKGIPL